MGDQIEAKNMNRGGRAAELRRVHVQHRVDQAEDPAPVPLENHAWKAKAQVQEDGMQLLNPGKSYVDARARTRLDVLRSAPRARVSHPGAGVAGACK